MWKAGQLLHEKSCEKSKKKMLGWDLYKVLDTDCNNVSETVADVVPDTTRLIETSENQCGDGGAFEKVLFSKQQ